MSSATKSSKPSLYDEDDRLSDTTCNKTIMYIGAPLLVPVLWQGDGDRSTGIRLTPEVRAEQAKEESTLPPTITAGH